MGETTRDILKNMKFVQYAVIDTMILSLLNNPVKEMQILGERKQPSDPCGLIIAEKYSLQKKYGTESVLRAEIWISPFSFYDIELIPICIYCINDFPCKRSFIIRLSDQARSAPYPAAGNVEKIYRTVRSS